MHTTLNQIRSHSPCRSGWAKLLRTLNKTQADDEPLTMDVILASNGLVDAIWCLRAMPDADRLCRLFAVFCAKQNMHLLTDARSIKAIEVAEAYANELASTEELSAARQDVADAALDAADAAQAAAYATAVAVYATAAAAAVYAAAATAAVVTVDAAAVATVDVGAVIAVRGAQRTELLRLCSL